MKNASTDKSMIGDGGSAGFSTETMIIPSRKASTDVNAHVDGWGLW